MNLLTELLWWAAYLVRDRPPDGPAGLELGLRQLFRARRQSTRALLQRARFILQQLVEELREPSSCRMHDRQRL